MNSAFPVVTIDYTHYNCTAVCSNNVKGMEELLKYIYKKGHRKIAYIHGQKNSNVTRERLTSFYRTMEELPEMELHVSTQANVVSYHAAKFWYDNGAKRVILGRETSKDQIQEIMKNKPEDLEVEMFIHGALCWAYSGRCFHCRI